MEADCSDGGFVAEQGLGYMRYRGLRIGLRHLRSNASTRPLSEDLPEMPGYFNAYPNSSTTRLASRLEASRSSPSATSPLHSPPKTLQQDEGSELLPPYSCSLKAEGVFQMKTEMENPFDRAESRTWNRVFLVLKGTMLSIHRVKDPGIFTERDLSQLGTPDRPLGTRAGSLIRTYTLQHAEVGIASDYQKRDFVLRALFLRMLCIGSTDERILFKQKRHYVIRVRVETDQLLLCCSTVETFLYWLECLSAAIDLAPPLDERSLPRHRTIPVRRRRRQPAQSMPTHEDALPPPRPLVLETAASDSNESGLEAARSLESSATSTGLPTGSPLTRRWSNSVQSVFGDVRDSVKSRPLSDVSTSGKNKWRWSITSMVTTSSQTEEIPSVVIRESNSIEDLRAASDAARWRATAAQQLVDAYIGEELVVPEDPIDGQEGSGSDTNVGDTGDSGGTSSTDEKWCPPTTWSYARHVRYARRCMTNLGSDAPRQSDIIVKDGAKWKISWDLGELVKIEPGKLPDYQEAVATKKTRLDPEERAIPCF